MGIRLVEFHHVFDVAPPHEGVKGNYVLEGITMLACHGLPAKVRAGHPVDMPIDIFQVVFVFAHEYVSFLNMVMDVPFPCMGPSSYLPVAVDQQADV